MQSSYFYPRPPRGGRHPARFADVAIKQFLSTPSARRATATEFQGRFGSFDFYPRPPRGGRHQAAGNNGSARPDFYPRPPRGGRLPLFGVSLRNQTISIHALREEGDPGGCADQLHQIDFYPRSPRGGRRRKPGLGDKWFKISIHALREEGDILWEHFKRFMGEFLSTPSARRATGQRQRLGRDHRDFYPRPPRGGRRGTANVVADDDDFYPRPPRGGRR